MYLQFLHSYFVVLLDFENKGKGTGIVLLSFGNTGHEQDVYYLGKVLQGLKKNYSMIEKMCLSLYFAAIKLRRYFLSTTMLAIARTRRRSNIVEGFGMHHLIQGFMLVVVVGF
ncbi:hypothetical protein L6452_12903 [Arctium lappa]|uniref:Uncharacterized protein n=1 Tax=Arctium lappa TaxID=4217 RepID=A0ACB9CH08_ARCLA|nr:hypothetical protein L6452_12903 [Arctium lappa]